jgi:xanthine dehydrogenase accessory factor
MIGWISKAQQLIEDNAPFVVITVLQTIGSTPCDCGDKLIYIGSKNSNSADSLYGSIGGGMVEYRACEYAQNLLEQKNEEVAPYVMHLDSNTLSAHSGQCCGGKVQLFFELFSGNDCCMQWLNELSLCYQQQKDALILSVQTQQDFYKRVYAQDGFIEIQKFLASLQNSPSLSAVFEKWGLQKESFSTSSGYNAYYYQEQEIKIVIEKVAFSQVRTVMLFGCGHISRALVAIISQLPVRIYWVDDRPQEFEVFMQQYVDRELPNNVTILCQDFLSVEIPADAYCLVITYSHHWDYQVCKHILSTSSPCYVGLIGSKSKDKRFRSFLQKEENIKSLDKFSCPIGEVYQSHKSPTAVAISIANHLLKKL